MSLKGKKVLLIIPGFYGYEKVIQHTIEGMGGTCSFVENKAFRHDIHTKSTNWLQSLFSRKNRYVTDKILPASKSKFDFAFFINLFSFHPEVVENLRQQNPDIKCFLYLWDNVKGYHWEQYFKYFEKVYSFDPVESKYLGINYLPNFYPNISVENFTPEYDLSFVGSLQVHRLKILEEIGRKLKHLNKSFFFYMYLHPNYNRLKYNWVVGAVVNLFPGLFRGYKSLSALISKRTSHELVHHRPLTIDETIHVISKSKCVLDLPFPSQTGSTQRVIQALALNKKVITTNTAAVHEFFYNPEQVKIVSPENPEIDWDWIDRKNENKIDLTSLRIDHWLTQILLS